MKRAIVSLISSATEMVDALGAIGLLVGRSHECDYPPSVRALPSCTRPLIDVDADSRRIDEQVKNSARSALSIYEVFDDVLDRLQPTHILTQVQCDVCAVSLRDVERSIALRLASTPARGRGSRRGSGACYSRTPGPHEVLPGATKTNRRLHRMDRTPYGSRKLD